MSKVLIVTPVKAITLYLFLSISCSFGDSNFAPSSERQETDRSEAKAISRCTEQWREQILPVLHKKLATADIESLAAIPVSSNEVRVRVWKGFGITRLRGLFLDIADGKLSATYASEEREDKPVLRTRPLNSPLSGQEGFTQELLKFNIGQIPDQCERHPDRVGAEDGDILLIEFRDGPFSHSVLYEDLSQPKDEYDHKVKRLVDELSKEFRISL